jgi:hypothetical protein
VDVRIGLVPRSREEPRLDGPFTAHSLDPPAPLGEPDVAKTAAEETTLAALLGDDAERAEPPLDGLRVHALAVVGADELVAPLRERGHSQPAHLAAPRAEEIGVRRAEPKVNVPAGATRCGDRGVGVRRQLGHDLNEIDARLDEVLPEVAPADMPVTDPSRIDRDHARRIRPAAVGGIPPFANPSG